MPLPTAFKLALEHDEELSLDIVQILFEGGLKIDNKELVEESVIKNRPRVAQFLIENGAEHDATRTLIDSSRYGHTNIVNLLLETMSPNVRDSCFTPLGTACHNGQIDIVRTLLKHGADVNFHGRFEHILESACISENPDIVSIILKKGPIVNDKCSIYVACEIKTEENPILDMLIEAGAEVNVNNFYGPPLFNACRHGSLKSINKLLDAGADVNATDGEGFNVLMTVCTGDRKYLVPLLVNRGVNIDAQDNSGRTALMHAANNWKENMVEELLKFNPDTSIVDKDGKNAIEHAIRASYHFDVRAFRLIAEYERKNCPEHFEKYRELVNRMIECIDVGTPIREVFKQEGYFSYHY